MMNISKSLGLLKPKIQNYIASKRIFRAKVKRYVPGTHSAIFILAPNLETARKLSRGLVDEYLAGCINIIPKVHSLYNWDRKLHEEEEYFMMVKTRTSKVPEIADYVQKYHPYSTPEVISLRIDNGNPLFMKWLGESVP